ncbi:hypothetical protein [Paraburkholderia antibiotica]|uniref:Uncharacterized protein n=1 Tax=Paraburkholderia antibiotica TaxID=2728839 RepID=A0A7Y0A1U4_9BURK|nr:hypothetical protein [Paraburkholderia antibiotica]NML34961.1 hypothetical protein [Paraburkholderia antibiotica]
MTSLNVQFADGTEKVIVSYFGAPQDPSAWPNLGTVNATDARWEAYYAEQPTNAQAFLPVPETAD